MQALVTHVLGARPNFMKAAPVIRALGEAGVDQMLIHTGQHYDARMSDVFFADLGLPQPDVNLHVGSGAHGEQTAAVIAGVERELMARRPALLVVYGDVNSTLGAALAAAKLHVPIAHVEAGLRSFDNTMPEEINRRLTDQLCELLFVTSPEAIGYLANEGIASHGVHFVGNTMIDTLVALEGRFRGLETARRLGLAPGEFVLVTLHRPALVDGPLLPHAMTELAALARKMPVVFPVHPRTRKTIEADASGQQGLMLTEPVGYLEFLSLMAAACAVLTDSGGIQEETTYLGVPCFTLRDNTERPVTIRAGTNTLLGLEPAAIGTIPAALAERPAAPSEPPPLWDGKAAGRVAEVLA
jgi:UDP-N-acetylglucosamine 2-epimerase (non-hydrolysing)